MRLPYLFMLLALPLAGCDQLTGASDKAVADAEAVGFACRVSAKTPEDCMKENEARSPADILDGWKRADEDINSGKLDPTMRKGVAGTEAAQAAPEEAPAKTPPKK